MENVQMTVSGQVAVVTIYRPTYRNALNTQTYEELDACFGEIQRRKDIKVVILTGHGTKAFAAGADISEMVQANVTQGRALALLVRDVGLKLENMPQVTIAAVNGFALGGGCEISLACDMRIASENAQFALPETGLGIIPGGGGTQRLPQLIGKGRAKEMIFTGAMVDAQEAYRIGLVNHVVPQEELMDYCLDMANNIANRASYAISLAKGAINAGMNTDLASGLDMEVDLLAIAFATQDKLEGMRAFLEKRPPQFKDF